MGFLQSTGYRITGRIQSSLFANVYKAINPQTGESRRLIAIPPILTRSQRIRESLLDELNSLTDLRHPGIISLLSIHELHNRYFLETNLPEGLSLAAVAEGRAGNRLEEQEVIRWMRQPLEALIAAHDQNLLHRDLRPENMILLADETVALQDFGVAEALRQAWHLCREQTARSSIVYMAPEQILGRSLTVRSDIYSFGAVVYSLLAGHPPFWRGEIYNQILSETPARLHPDSPVLRAIIEQSLEKDAAARFTTFEDVQRQWKRLPVLRPAENVRPETVPLNLDEPFEKVQPEEEQPFNEGFYKIPWRPVALGLLIFALLIVLWQGVPPLIRLFSSFIGEEKAEVKNSSVSLNGALPDQADSLFSRGMLVLPSGGNAAEIYVTILKTDSTNSRALARLREIQERLILEIRQNLSLGQNSTAALLCRQGLVYFPQEPFLLEMSELIKQENDWPLILILNGSGTKGVAADLALSLGTLGFGQVETENYRVNGRIDWTVEKSFMQYRPGLKNTAGELAGRLGLSEGQVQENTQAQAGIVLVLGADHHLLRLK